MNKPLTELQKLIDYKKHLDDFRGNEINRNYWSSQLANHFPKITEQNERGEPIIIEFMGISFIRSNIS
jgi:hypothetical protein